MWSRVTEFDKKRVAVSMWQTIFFEVQADRMCTSGAPLRNLLEEGGYRMAVTGWPEHKWLALNTAFIKILLKGILTGVV